MICPGAPIGSNGVDGPYSLNDVLIYSSSNSAVIFHAWTTAAYTASQFEGFVPTPTGTLPTATPTCTPTNTLTVTPTINPCLLQSYVPMAGTATTVPGVDDIGDYDDDDQTTISLPFLVQLYDQTFTSMDLESNGKAHFAPGAVNYSNVCLPNEGDSYTIYPYWDDLRTDCTGCGILTAVSGTAPNRIFNIEWRASYYATSGTANFELRLYEDQSRFEVVYGTLDSGNLARSYMGLCSIAGCTVAQLRKS